MLSEEVDAGAESRVTPVQLVLGKEAVETRGVGEGVEDGEKRVEGHTDVARARVDAEGRLQKMVHLSGNLDVESRVEHGENHLLAPVDEVERRDAELLVEGADVEPLIHAGPRGGTAPAGQKGVPQSEIRDGEGKVPGSVGTVPGALLLEDDVDKVGLEQLEGALDVRVVGLLHAENAPLALALDVEDVEVLDEGPAAVLLEVADPGVAHPAVDTSTAREDPDAVLDAKVLPDGHIDHVDGQRDELPALGADGGPAAARADVVVVGEVNVEHHLLRHGLHEALGDRLPVLGLHRIHRPDLETRRVHLHHLLLELGRVLERRVPLVRPVLVLERKLPVCEVVGRHTGVAQPLEKQVEWEKVLVVVTHVRLCRLVVLLVCLHALRHRVFLRRCRRRRSRHVFYRL